MADELSILTQDDIARLREISRQAANPMSPDRDAQAHSYRPDSMPICNASAADAPEGGIGIGLGLNSDGVRHDVGLPTVPFLYPPYVFTVPCPAGGVARAWTDGVRKVLLSAADYSAAVVNSSRIAPVVGSFTPAVAFAGLWLVVGKLSSPYVIVDLERP